MATTSGITVVICVALWLLFCRCVIKGAAKLGDMPDAVELIRVARLG
jgi:hypothetical protein